MQKSLAFAISLLVFMVAPRMQAQQSIIDTFIVTQIGVKAMIEQHGPAWKNRVISVRREAARKEVETAKSAYQQRRSKILSLDFDQTLLTTSERNSLGRIVDSVLQREAQREAERLSKENPIVPDTSAVGTQGALLPSELPDTDPEYAALPDINPSGNLRNIGKAVLANYIPEVEPKLDHAVYYTPPSWAAYAVLVLAIVGAVAIVVAVVS